MTSGGEDRARLEDLGSQLAQLRERITELDRAVTALGSAGMCYLHNRPDLASYPAVPAFFRLQEEKRKKLGQLGTRLGQTSTATSLFFPKWYSSILSSCHAHTVSLARQSPEAADEPDKAKYVDSDAFEALQSMLSELQQEQERVIGTTAHLSHELEVNKEHVKVGTSARSLWSK